MEVVGSSVILCGIMGEWCCEICVKQSVECLLKSVCEIDEKRKSIEDIEPSYIDQRRSEGRS